MITIDPSSPVPPFEQIRARLDELIVSGSLAPGTRLPTVRQLAGDLAVAPNTVSKAYSALEADGLVRANRRQGTVVLAGAARSVDQRRSAVTALTERYLAELARLGADPSDGVEAIRRLSTPHG